jgi:DNA-binding GntR family transcriptional regulator
MPGSCGRRSEDIIFGRLPPGTMLVENALLARFPVTAKALSPAAVCAACMNATTAST